MYTAPLDLRVDLANVDITTLLPDLDVDKHQTELPRLARDPSAMSVVESVVKNLSTNHKLYHGDARRMEFIADESIHLIVTSPPYWTLKEYRDSEAQLGHIADYEEFLEELNKVWRECMRVLVKGGRLVIVVGDVCLSRRKHGRHAVIPLHASIQEHCRAIGFDNLAPIIWHKIANAQYEVENGSGGFLGKPYEPNGIIKNDIEYILMQRKPGGYRSPSLPSRVLSLLPAEEHKKMFQQIWVDVPGASTRDHPAPFPEELASRLVRMFSFVGDTVLDPFLGTGTTTLAAARWGRHSVGIEVDADYLKLAQNRLNREGIPFSLETRGG